MTIKKEGEAMVDIRVPVSEETAADLGLFREFAGVSGLKKLYTAMEKAARATLDGTDFQEFKAEKEAATKSKGRTAEKPATKAAT
jgi:hypothetical protein